MPPAWDPKKHPRGKKGSPSGGKFVSKEGGASEEDRAAVATAFGQRGKNSLGQRIKDFQRRNGLTVDGVVGRQTAKALLGDVKGARNTAIGKMDEATAAKLRKKFGRKTVKKDDTTAPSPFASLIARAVQHTQQVVGVNQLDPPEAPAADEEETAAPTAEESTSPPAEAEAPAAPEEKAEPEAEAPAAESEATAEDEAEEQPANPAADLSISELAQVTDELLGEARAAGLAEEKVEVLRLVIEEWMRRDVKAETSDEAGTQQVDTETTT